MPTDDGQEWARLTLNPGARPDHKNPLCPDCKHPIRALEGQNERRFVCQCDTLHEFRFQAQTSPAETLAEMTGLPKEEFEYHGPIPELDELTVEEVPEDGIQDFDELPIASGNTALEPQPSSDENDPGECPLCGQQYDHTYEVTSMTAAPNFRDDARVCSQRRVPTGRRYYVHLQGDHDE